MAHLANTLESHMEFSDIPGTSLKVSRIAIGTWAIGGWMWGGTDEAESVSTIQAALNHGITVVDTAPSINSATRKKSLARQSLKAACARAQSSPRRSGLMEGRQDFSQCQPGSDQA